MVLSSEALQVARQSRWLHSLQPGVQAAILAAAEFQQFQPGSCLFSAGAESRGLYLIVSGRVRTWSSDEEGHPVVLKALGPGELVGCIAAFSGQSQPASAQAIGPVQLLFWPLSDLHRLLGEYPELSANALRLLAERTVALLQRLVMVSTASASARIAATLLDLSGGEPRRVDVSRQELADLTATTMHTVSRTISAWHRCGWLIGGRSRIDVLDVGALAREAPQVITGELRRN